MPNAAKTGSARRKGDDYQDLTALRLALDHYIAGTPFTMYLEFENSGNLDDIVFLRGKHIDAYQVRYSVSPHALYHFDDLTDTTSRVYLAKFSQSWAILRARFPDHRLTACLWTTRSLDADIADLVTPTGTFQPAVVDNRRRGAARQLRSCLQAAVGLDPEAFRAFLSAFQFLARRPTLADLEQHIRAVLLDQKLGFSDPAVFFRLKEVIQEHAVLSHDPITPDLLDTLFARFHTKLFVPQIFPVNRESLVDRTSFSYQLANSLRSADGTYLLITGLPGSGKSTALTTYFDGLDPAAYEVFRYYCFVGVNDNLQTLRIRAETFHANLLEAFHRRYPHILDRRFDYSQSHFLDSLRVLADYFLTHNRKLVLVLDGLDHAERLESATRDSVVSALPPSLPTNTVVVVGTQELHKWPHFLKQVRDSPDTHIPMPPFSRSDIHDYFTNKRGIPGLSHADIVELHKKSQGLPLHLRYTAEVLLSNDPPSAAIAALSPAISGDIRNYYAVLWDELDSVGSGTARHLCAVTACLRFAVHRNEFFALVRSTMSRPVFEDAYKLISHLLRHSHDKLSVFHNSFREFVLDQLPNDWIRQVRSDIAAFLKREKDSPRWFAHVFQYCYDAADYSYSCTAVDAQFVERALARCRPSREILDALHCAIESAFQLQDLVHLSRLGILASRTEERLQHILDRPLLANTLLAQGRHEDVISFAYSREDDRWVVEHSTALAIVSALGRFGLLDVGRRLFGAFMDDFRGFDMDTGDGGPTEIALLADCLGIYPDRPAKTLRCLSRFTFTPDTLEAPEPYAPGYAPHLAAYVDALVRFHHAPEWARLRRVRKLFPNALVRYLLIRALARHDKLEQLRADVLEYVRLHNPIANSELAYYAARAGLPPSVVASLAGTLPAPPATPPEHLSISDPTLQDSAYSFVIVGYLNDRATFRYLLDHVRRPRTLWSSALEHLLKACYSLGCAFRGDSDEWYADAHASIGPLLDAERGTGERIYESIYVIRDALHFSIGSLTREIQDRLPDRIPAWIGTLRRLRKSVFWTTHIGIGESMEDYGFELRLWERLGELPEVRASLSPILGDCASTYTASPLLKGSSRSQHFLRLAAIMARCGMRPESEHWLHYGVRSSLIYGYRKDGTLGHLVDVLKLVNQRRPQLALERCARILAMVRWMPHLTDGRGTKHFTQGVFAAVLSVDREAAWRLLSHLSDAVGRWKMQECLEQYALAATDVGPEYLWCLAEAFSNEYSDDGAYSNQVIRIREHLVDLVRRSSPSSVVHRYEARLRHFVLTEVTPRHWPERFRTSADVPWSLPQERSDADVPLKASFRLHGESVARDELGARCKVSFSELRRILDALHAEEDHFYEPTLVKEVVRHHISAARTPEELTEIWKYLESVDEWRAPAVFDDLGKRYAKFGRWDDAVSCFGSAYVRATAWQVTTAGVEHLTALAETNPLAAETYVLQKTYQSAAGARASYCTPCVAAGGLHVLNKDDALNAVFDDFLGHCESMFAQLPDDDNYHWLAESSVDDWDEERSILDFCIRQLDTPEIDHGDRLVRALAALAIDRSGPVVSVLVVRALSSAGRVRRRLLMILYTLATRKADLLAPHQLELVGLLEQHDYCCRETGLRILAAVQQATALDQSVAAAVRKLEAKYSVQVFHRGHRMTGRPSAEFESFLKKSTLFDFSDRIELLERILEVPGGCCIAAIEQRLASQGWSIDEERLRVKDNWEGHVHPEGWPVVWITTEFQELATTALWSILDEGREKWRLTEAQTRSLWLATQTVDPEYAMGGLGIRPADVPALYVTDVEAWFRELEEVERFQVSTGGGDGEDARWITLFETRMLSQEEKYSVPYVQEISLRTGLIPRDLYGGVQALEALDLQTERILPSNAMAITAEELREWMADRRGGSRSVRGGWVPPIAVHRNPPSFCGYAAVCSLAPFIVRDFDLSFDGLHLMRRAELVAKYEAWQEGYRDETYSRDTLSSGVRLRATRAFVTEICRRYERILCVRVDEKREHYDAMYERIPRRKCESRRYVLHHLG